MSMADFIRLEYGDGRDGTLYLNRNYITSFCYYPKSDVTEVYIHGEPKPYCFAGNITEKIKTGINRLI